MRPYFSHLPSGSEGGRGGYFINTVSQSPVLEDDLNEDLRFSFSRVVYSGAGCRVSRDIQSAINDGEVVINNVTAISNEGEKYKLKNV